MNTKVIFGIIGGSALLFSAGQAKAQETVVVEETTAIVTEQVVECKTHYSSSWRDNWFIQAGAGVSVPFTENRVEPGMHSHRHATAVYNLGFGHWFSPYLALRFSGYYGKIHYNYGKMNSAQMGNLNADLMWDMTSSVCGVNPNRVFSFIPFVGIGGTYTWNFKGSDPTIPTDDFRHRKTREWTLPVSAGFQIRLRMCKYADFFAEARASFYGDNFNNIVESDPIECNVTATAGVSFTIGGRKFQSYNPCDYLGYINNLNGQVNNLRGQLADAEAALAAAQAAAAEPSIVESVTDAVATVPVTPLLSTVRFKINSAVVTPEEQVNVYNIAQWMKTYPDAKVMVDGYADKDTGSAEYNMKLSQRRAQAVIDILTKKYGIDASRLTPKAYGSDSQPYPENNWNRIVVFTQP